MVAKNFGRTLYWETFSRLFYFVCKKKKSQRDFEIFCSYRHFLFCRFLFAYCGCSIKGVVAPQHIGQLDKCLFLLGQRSLQSFFNVQEQRLHGCTQTLRLFRQHSQRLKGIRLYMFGMRNGKDFCRIGRIVQSIVECFLLRQLQCLNRIFQTDCLACIMEQIFRCKGLSIQKLI